MPLTFIQLVFIISLFFCFFAFFLLIIMRFISLLFYNFFSVIFFGGGGLYVASEQKTVETIISLAGVQPGEKTVDLGSGDGRIVIAMAKAGAEAHGYEINPFLVWISKRNIKKAGLDGSAFVHRKNFWNEDLSKFTVVSLYCISYAMHDLEEKLKKEIKPGSRVVSNYFVFPSWQPKKKEGNTSLYVV